MDSGVQPSFSPSQMTGGEGQGPGTLWDSSIFGMQSISQLKGCGGDTNPSA